MGIAGAGAHAIFNRHVHGSKPFLLLTIIVFSVGVTGFLTSINKGFIEWVQAHVITTTGANWATTTAVFVFSMLPSFCLFKIRQASCIVPAYGALLLPLFIIHGMATHINHTVDGWWAS